MGPRETSLSQFKTLHRSVIYYLTRTWDKIQPHPPQGWHSEHCAVKRVTYNEVWPDCLACICPWQGNSSQHTHTHTRMHTHTLTQAQQGEVTLTCVRRVDRLCTVTPPPRAETTACCTDLAVHMATTDAMPRPPVTLAYPGYHYHYHLDSHLKHLDLSLHGQQLLAQGSEVTTIYCWWPSQGQRLVSMSVHIWHWATFGLL